MLSVNPGGGLEFELCVNSTCRPVQLIMYSLIVLQICHPPKLKADRVVEPVSH
jgi:hypothetical protein